MTETTEGMNPVEACRWYYDNLAAGREMERRYTRYGTTREWVNDDRNRDFDASYIYRLKKRVLITGKLACDSPPFPDIPCIEDPGPEAVVLSRMPTVHDINNNAEVRDSEAKAIVNLLQSLTLEVER